MLPEMNVSDAIRYVGINDHDITLFEAQFDLERGMAYNSFVILDEKTAVTDGVDAACVEQWLANVAAVLGDRKPSYFIVHHMEPDHSAGIEAFMAAYPEATIVSSAAAFRMMKQFFGTDYADRQLAVKEGSVLELGAHRLTFVTAPMVHWPEVVMSFENTEGVLFSADAFGKFGANDIEDPEGWACEARRYYFGIVGKYGPQVQAVLKKAAALPVKTICPLHGPVLTDTIPEVLATYNTWSSYQPEDEGVTIVCACVYGHTLEAARLLQEDLTARGVKAKVHDIVHDDWAEAVEDAFRYDRLVLAASTYNMDVFPAMRTFIHHLTLRGYKNRKVAFIENGSWAPAAAKVMKSLFEGSSLTFAETGVTVKSALDAASTAAVKKLAEELA